MTIQEAFQNYIQGISSKFQHLETSEIGYRTDFELLMKEIFAEIKVSRIDHDAKAFGGNKPDYVVYKEIPILYIETKDIGVSLDKIEKSDQMTRYFGYANLVLTDYVEFRFYRNGVRYEEPIVIATFDKKERQITPQSENYEHLAKSLIDFAQSHKEPIKSGLHLAKVMGGKALRIRENVKHFLSTKSDTNLELTKIHETIKKLLVHDLSLDDFADMYAQTLVYGLFVARFHDESPDNFTRQEARDLVPASNPLLRHFFDHIVGPNFDKRLEYIVNELCEVFSHADVPQLMNKYFKPEGKNGDKDPVIHFYEDFLQEYDPAKRKSFGAYYTPLPVVKFIVRAVDDILQKDFGLSGGLANTSKVDDQHKVQILDPAVGTGTFLTEVLNHVHAKFENQSGRWPSYVHHDLLPRLYGFEIMMAPYTIAHLKMSMLLKETGFKYFNNTRLGIYLTNSLEETTQTLDLFGGFGLAESISEESKQAAKIKNEKPIMVVIGNPPYSGISSNETPYANSLVDKYKVEPGGKMKLQERKHWLNDDYVKFIAFAEKMVEKNGDGIVAMITNNGYLDNPTFRGMRWHLAKTFDKIYVLDLHGNAKKKEVSPDGSKDENVFDIMQGVGIILAVKTGKKNPGELAEVYHAGLYGTRDYKLAKLSSKPDWQKLELDENRIYFLPKDNSGSDEYGKGFALDELFQVNNVGFVTACDSLNISFTQKEQTEKIHDLLNLEETTWRQKYSRAKDAQAWKYSWAKNDAIAHDSQQATKVSYRPFDERYSLYTGKSGGLYARPVYQLMQHFLAGPNVGLVANRRIEGARNFADIFITNKITDARRVSLKETNYIFPLYLYSEDGTKTANFDKKISEEISDTIGSFTSEDLFDYIYATLHSPSYRGKYEELLKINFPRIPYPKDRKTFSALVKLGGELRGLHLLESASINPFEISYEGDGENEVVKPEFRDGKVYINETQFFGNVPEIVWNFYIGGYQPAQKWLKDRKGRQLVNEEIEHYQKIIIALRETDRLMQEIDKVYKAQFEKE